MAKEGEPASTAEDLRTTATDYERKATERYGVAAGFMAVGLAGLVSLGIGVAKDNNTFMAFGLASGLLAPAYPMSRRAKHLQGVAQGYHDQAATAQNIETMGLAPESQLESLMAAQLPGVVRILIESGTLQELMGKQSDQAAPESAPPNVLQFPPPQPPQDK